MNFLNRFKSFFVSKKNDVLISLDIGSTKICCIVATKGEDDTIKLLGISTRAYKCLNDQGVIDNALLVRQEIRKCIDEACLQAQNNNDDTEDFLKKAEIKAGITNKKTRCITVRPSMKLSNNSYYSSTNVREKVVITKKHTRQLQEDASKYGRSEGYSVNEVLGVFPQTYYLDGTDETHNPIGQRAHELRGCFRVAIVEDTICNQFRQIIEEIYQGIPVKVTFQTQGYASSLALFKPSDIQNSVIIADIGGYYTNVAFFDRGRLVNVADIPIGGNLIDALVQRTYPQVDLGIFGSVKEKYAYAVAPEGLDKDTTIVIPGRYSEVQIRHINFIRIIENCLERIALMIRSEITSLSSERLYSGLQFDRIYLTGGAAQMKSIDKLFEKSLGIPTETKLPSSMINMKDGDHTKLRYEQTTAWGMLVSHKQFLEKELEGIEN